MAGQAPATIITFTIAAAASLSDIQMVSGRVCGILFPDAWDAASLTFLGSPDSQTVMRSVWSLPLGTAVEATIASAGIPTSGGRYFPLSLNDWLGLNFLQLRSGTAGAPVNQTAQRQIKLALAG